MSVPVGKGHLPDASETEILLALLNLHLHLNRVLMAVASPRFRSSGEAVGARRTTP